LKHGAGQRWDDCAVITGRNQLRAAMVRLVPRHLASQSAVDGHCLAEGPSAGFASVELTGLFGLATTSPRRSRHTGKSLRPDAPRAGRQCRFKRPKEAVGNQDVGCIGRPQLQSVQNGRFAWRRSGPSDSCGLWISLLRAAPWLSIVLSIPRNTRGRKRATREHVFDHRKRTREAVRMLLIYSQPPLARNSQ
jgi:hypothetical protein